MAKIVQMQDVESGEDIFPAAKTKAVYDKDGKSLDALLNKVDERLDNIEKDSKSGPYFMT
jgi:hypothetical protein